MMKITTVHFVNPLPIGRELDTHNYLVNGMSILGSELTLSKYDDSFLRIDFRRGGSNGYSQFIPWAQVSTVLFEQVEDVVKPTQKRS